MDEAVASRGHHQDDDFDRIYRSMHDELLRIARRYARDSHAARDALQNATYRAFRRWRAGKIDDLPPYLRTCVYTACMDLHRASKRKRKALDALAATHDLTSDAADHGLLTQVDHVSVRAAFDQLSVECREMLQLRVIDAVPVSDVAEKLYIAEGTVKSRCSRCLEQLGRLMQG